VVQPRRDSWWERLHRILSSLRHPLNCRRPQRGPCCGPPRWCCGGPWWDAATGGPRATQVRRRRGRKGRATRVTPVIEGRELRRRDSGARARTSGRKRDVFPGDPPGLFGCDRAVTRPKFVRCLPRPCGPFQSMWESGAQARRAASRPLSAVLTGKIVTFPALSGGASRSLRVDLCRQADTLVATSGRGWWRSNFNAAPAA